MWISALVCACSANAAFKTKKNVTVSPSCSSSNAPTSKPSAFCERYFINADTSPGGSDAFFRKFVERQTKRFIQRMPLLALSIDRLRCARFKTKSRLPRDFSLSKASKFLRSSYQASTDRAGLIFTVFFLSSRVTVAMRKPRCLSGDLQSCQVPTFS